MSNLPTVDIDIPSLIANTEALARSLYVVRDSFGLKPEKDHIGSFIDFSDLTRMTPSFVQELVNTVTDYVYSKAKADRARTVFENEGRSQYSAYHRLYQQAKQKFRSSSGANSNDSWELARGQFSELLLFNLLQHFFGAAPLVRKMPITTSPAHERFGADAIHVGYRGDRLVLYLGEAKTYDRKSATFSSCFRASVRDAIAHYRELRSELRLYVYEDFVSPELEALAQDFLNGKRKDIEVHLVALVAFELPEKATGGTREDLVASAEANLRKAIKRLRRFIFYDIESAYLPRMNYVIFAEEDLSQLIGEFVKAI